MLRTAGQAEAWLATATDIDDLQRALTAAQESEEQLRLAVDAAQLGIYVFDLATGEHTWSSELKGIFGLPPGSAPPRRIVDFIHPEDRTHFEAVRKASLDPAGQGVFQDEHRIHRPDGSERWVFVKGRVSFDAHGRCRKARSGLGIVLDITERKLAERALVQSETRYRMLFEHANDIVATLELNGRIVSINPAAREILGFAPEELIGKTIYEFVPREQMAMQEAVLQSKVEGQVSTQYDLEVATKDGRRRILGINSRLVFDAAGKPILIHSIARDITERKEADVRQQLLIRELQHRTKNLLAVIQANGSIIFWAPFAAIFFSLERPVSMPWLRIALAQGLIAITLVVACLTAAKQWPAAMLDYQTALGAPWIDLLGIKVYAPWKLLVWWLSFDVQATGGVCTRRRRCRVWWSCQRSRRHRGSHLASQP